MRATRWFYLWAALALLASLCIGVVCASGAAGQVAPAAPLGTKFTYQGQLRDAGGPLNATCDLQFTLWDAQEGGTQVGTAVLLEGVALQDGLFSASLDFGPGAFQGHARWLEVGVACPAGSGVVMLEPRQELTASPYALYALAAPWSGLAGVPADLLDGDDDTTYSAGNQLDLTGTTFDVVEGSGSGLDADLLDGHHGSYYLDWDNLAAVPPGLDDGDDDALAGLSCGGGQVAKWDGSAWACAADEDTTYSAGNQLDLTGTTFDVVDGAGSGLDADLLDGQQGSYYLDWDNLAAVPAGFADGVDDDTTYSAGTGLSQAGTQFSIGAPYRLPQGCANGQIAEWTGSVWTCGNDDTGPGGAFWSLTGNAGTSPATHFLGTTDNQALEVRVNNARALRIEPDAESPNLIGGHSTNAATEGAHGATIGGGGAGGSANRVFDHYGTVGGGRGNRAGEEWGDLGSSAHATVGGGYANTASGYRATVSGGAQNTASSRAATVAGGEDNRAGAYGATVSGGTGNSAWVWYATVGGGTVNVISGTAQYGTVGGGYANVVSGTAQYATVGGGRENAAADQYATVGGGRLNTASGYQSTVSGGVENSAAYRAAVGGGLNNEASGAYAAIGGGSQHVASGESATVGGGYSNTASSSHSTVGGGYSNSASGGESTIGGGDSNSASGSAATIGGGSNNAADADFATIAGGGPSDPADPDTTRNRVTDAYGTVGGGGNNQAGDADGNPTTARYATIGGGSGNIASVFYTTVGGGGSNTASGLSAIVGGGWGNAASNNYATVSGGVNNTASGPDSTVGGGSGNTASDYDSTVGGGYENTAGGLWATVGGGMINTASGDEAAIGGGYNNTASGYAATIGGGQGNVITATAQYATIGGGRENTAADQYATVGGGRLNTASGYQSTVSGGVENSAAYRATVGGGLNNDASGAYAAIGGGSQHVALGDSATIPGGYANEAAGTYSFAAGRQAKAANAGTFVWADSNAFDFPGGWFPIPFSSNSFNARATGGVRFVVGIDGSGNTTQSCVLLDGTGWSCSSDRNVKENFEDVDALQVLERLSGVPIQTWNAKGADPGIRHMGPVAQDFYAAFGLGGDDKQISTVDTDGVALAAIQGLYQLNQQLEAENVAQQAQIDSLEARLAALEAGGGGTSLPVRLPGGWLLLGGGIVAVGLVAGRRVRGGGR